jgi:CRP/FNR family cyclic AMP-dependent transcriptional regulator
MVGLTLGEIIGFLLETAMFGDLSAHELSEVVHVMGVQRLREHQVVFREGDAGDGWYVVFAGEVEVVKSGGLGDAVIATLGPRSCFGEMAILDGSPRSATVRATAPSTVLKIPRAAFVELLDAGNLAAFKLIHQMAVVLVARQRSTTARLAELLDVDSDTAVRERLGPIIAGSSVAE